MNNYKNKIIFFLIGFLYLISGFLLKNIYFDDTKGDYIISLSIWSILYSYILIKIFHLINKLLPLKYLAYKNTYIIVLCIFVINLLLSHVYDIFHPELLEGYLQGFLHIYYFNFLFILYILYSIKHYNKYYGTFLSYKTKYSFLLHIVFLFVYCIILLILFYIMLIVYVITDVVIFGF